MNKKWLATMGTGVLLLSSAIGMGIAHANTVRTAAPPAPAAITQPAPIPDNEAQGTVDKDNLQVQTGSQVQDTKGTDTEKGNEVKKTDNEASENLPGGGHADAAGANVNHDFQGVE